MAKRPVVGKRARTPVEHSARDNEIAVRDRLQALADESNGRLTPDAVVEDASDPDSPLHLYFEWNDTNAARQWRLEQARALIRSVQVVFRNSKETLTTVAYVRDPQAGAKEQGYVSITAVKREEDLAREVVAEEFMRAASALRRARAIARALGLDAEIGKLVDDLTALRSRLELRGGEAALNA